MSLELRIVVCSEGKAGSEQESRCFEILKAMNKVQNLLAIKLQAVGDILRRGWS